MSPLADALDARVYPRAASRGHLRVVGRFESNDGLRPCADDWRACGRSRIAVNGIRLRFESGEDRQQARDRQQAVVSSTDMQQLQTPCRPHKRAVGGHQLAETATVDVGDSARLRTIEVRCCRIRLLILS